MYTQIEAFDAKTQLSALLREVEQNGHCYTITVRGRPIADLIPSEMSTHRDIKAAVEAMKNFKKIEGVSDNDLKQWIAEGLDEPGFRLGRT